MTDWLTRQSFNSQQQDKCKSCNMFFWNYIIWKWKRIRTGFWFLWRRLNKKTPRPLPCFCCAGQKVTCNVSSANEKRDGSHSRGRWVRDSLYRGRPLYCCSVHRPHTKSAGLPTLLPVHRTSLLTAKTRTSYHLYGAYARYHLKFKLLVSSYTDMR